ncbi:MAG: aldo/keto reductase [Candidatus Binatia bacterium]
MELKQLGTTGVKLPEIGLGTWDYRGGVEPLRKGISLGSFLIDTAEIYHTEGTVGEAVRGQRDQIFIATKVSADHLRYDDVLRAAEDSLRRLGTNVIDLYQVHWPNRNVPIRETMRAMEELVDMGKVKFIGVSNFSVRDLKEAQESMAKYRVVSNQVLYSLDDREIEENMLPYCEENNILVIAYSPLARGGLTTRPLLKRRHSMNVLQGIVKETGKTMAQVALNWCISKPSVVAIPKSDKVDRVVENCQASGWRLSVEQLEALNAAFT